MSIAELLEIAGKTIEQYGFIKGFLILSSIGGGYILIKYKDFLSKIDWKIDNILGKDNSEDLLTHSLMSEYENAIHDVRTLRASNEFRTQIGREYFMVSIEVEKRMIKEYILSKKWKDMTPEELFLSFNEFITKMIEEENREFAYRGIPIIFTEKMNDHMYYYISEIYDAVKIICDNDVLKNKKYNSLKIEMLMTGAKAKWSRIRNEIPIVMSQINGQFKKQNITFKGLKDE